MAEKESGNTPVANPNPQAPAAGEQTSSQGNPTGGTEGKEDEKVTLSKKEHDDLQKKAAQASEAQSRADTLQQMLDRKKGKKIEDTPTSFDQKEVLAAVTGISAKVLQNAKYQQLVAGNPLLAKVLASRPWELLDNDEFADHEDLVNQVLDELDKMVLSNIGKKTEVPSQSEAGKEPEKTKEPIVPQPTASNPAGNGNPTAPKQQPARGGLVTITDRIADSIKGRISIK